MDHSPTREKSLSQFMIKNATKTVRYVTFKWIIENHGQAEISYVEPLMDLIPIRLRLL